jgi:hypothetical protein
MMRASPHGKFVFNPEAAVRDQFRKMGRNQTLQLAVPDLEEIP